MLRALRLGAEPADQAEFFHKAIARNLYSPTTRVLVSGASDTALAELIYDVAYASNRRTEITFVDICRTPGHLALRSNVSSALKVYQADILTWETRKTFDLILTHSFLGQIAEIERPRMFQKWADLLVPGGALITVNRLRQKAEDVRFTASNAERLAALATERLRNCPQLHTISPNECRQAVLEYALQRETVPLRSANDVAEYCKTAGLVVESLEACVLKKPGALIVGPAVGSSAEYIQLVARKT